MMAGVIDQYHQASFSQLILLDWKFHSSGHRKTSSYIIFITLLEEIRKTNSQGHFFIIWVVCVTGLIKTPEVLVS